MSYLFTGFQRNGLILGTTAVDISGQITASAWFKPQVMGRVHDIYAKPYVSGTVRWRLHVQADNTVQWFWRWTTSINDFSQQITSAQITAGWNFIAGVKQAGTTLIYLNGAVAATGANANGIGDGPVDLGVFNGDDNSLYTNGWGAECAVWAAGLTVEELGALWRGANATQIRRQSLAMYWPMMGGPGNTVADGTNGHVDLSGNGRHLRTQFGSSDTTFVDDHPPVSRAGLR